ncbi:MAG: BACON domain-containing carbohydrate-binding protein, partial [Desulfosarcinaceae bacterium]
HLTAELTVDPAFLVSLGLPADQAAVASESIQSAGERLDADLQAALSTARINVTVLDADDGGRLVESAVVGIPDLADAVICEGCGGATDVNGQLTLTLKNMPADRATEVTATVSSVPGYTAVTAPTIEVVPLATVDLEIALSNTATFELNVQGGGQGGGRVTSIPAGIDCTLTADVLSGDGSERFAEGSEIELTATPDRNSAFAGWSGDACTEAGSTCTLTLTAGTTVTANFEPSCNADEYGIDASKLSFATGGGSGTLTVTAPEGCPWSVAVDKTWISVDPETANGSGDGSVTYAVAPNPEGSRSASLAAAGQRFTVHQEAAPCEYTLTPSGANSPATGDEGSFSVSASYAACTLPATAVSSDPWVTVSSVGDSWPVSVSYAVNPNHGPERSATITIAEKGFAIDQAAAACSYALSPTSASPDAAGGTGTITVTPSYAGCTTAWTATAGATWVTITAGASGSGEGTVSYSVAPNSGAERTATLTVADHRFTITQSDPYLVDQVNWPPFPSGTGTGSVGLNHYFPRQSFTPRFNRLTGVDLYLETVDGSNGDEAVIVRIFSEGSEVGRATQDVKTGFEGSLHFDFASPLTITAGTTCNLFVTNSPDGALKANSTFAWRYSILEGDGTYSGGRAWHSDRPWADEDFLFRTYGYDQ